MSQLMNAPSWFTFLQSNTAFQASIPNHLLRLLQLPVSIPYLRYPPRHPFVPVVLRHAVMLEVLKQGIL